MILDTFIISNNFKFTLFRGLYCDFYYVLRFLPFLYFPKANDGLLSKKSWNLKKCKQEGLMFWNMFLNILWKSLSVELSSASIPVKVNNSLCTKHLRAATSVMDCAFFKKIKRNKRNTIYLCQDFLKGNALYMQFFSVFHHWFCW